MLGDVNDRLVVGDLMLDGTSPLSTASLSRRSRARRFWNQILTWIREIQNMQVWFMIP